MTNESPGRVTFGGTVGAAVVLAGLAPSVCGFQQHQPPLMSRSSCRRHVVLWRTVSNEDTSFSPRLRRRKRDIIRKWWTGEEGEEKGSSQNYRGGRTADVPVLLSEDEVCLLPGDTVTRVEDAPGNARRIFSAIDIFASVDDVWGVLTAYDDLQNVVPNLLRNEVVERRPDGCRMVQVGAAELVPGIAFRARCTLDVTEYPEGIPPALIGEYVSCSILMCLSVLHSQPNGNFHHDIVHPFALISSSSSSSSSSSFIRGRERGLRRPRHGRDRRCGHRAGAGLAAAAARGVPAAVRHLPPAAP